MPDSIILKGKVIITGQIITKTGLHIGGAAAGLDIGGIDNPIIRHPVTREPYIPGSSLRGKMRSLLDRRFGKPLNQMIQAKPPVVRVHECDRETDYVTCEVCQIFGVTPGGERKSWTKLKPTRLLIRDTGLDKGNNEKLLAAKLDLPFTEVKWEATIDRITAAAVPRQNERVPAETVFGPFEFIYNLYDINGTGVADDVAWLVHVFKAMELLEDDYLGGYGSRGTGKVAFEEIDVKLRSHAYYAGLTDEEPLITGAKNLQALNLTELLTNITTVLQAVTE
jgi:CRISPR-associated protein Csm3